MELPEFDNEVMEFYLQYEIVYDEILSQTESVGIRHPYTEDDCLSAEYKTQDAMRQLTNSKLVQGSGLVDTSVFDNATAVIANHPYNPGGITPLTYAHKPLGNVGRSDWNEIEVIVDSGACETVMPRNLCQLIPIVPSAQSLAKIEYEVASGKTIPNLGGRH